MDNWERWRVYLVPRVVVGQVTGEGAPAITLSCVQVEMSFLVLLKGYEAWWFEEMRNDLAGIHTPLAARADEGGVEAEPLRAR